MEEDSEEEEIGTRRNRRRILRKASTDEHQPIRINIKCETSKQPIDENEAEQRHSKITSATVVDDDKPARSKKNSREESRSPEKKPPSDSTKSRQCKLSWFLY